MAVVLTKMGLSIIMMEETVSLSCKLCSLDLVSKVHCSALTILCCYANHAKIYCLKAIGSLRTCALRDVGRSPIRFGVRNSLLTRVFSAFCFVTYALII